MTTKQENVNNEFENVVNRSFIERFMNVLLFELIAIGIITPLFSWLFDRPMQKIGLTAIAVSIIAGVSNYLFNLAFDKWIMPFFQRKQYNTAIKRHIAIRSIMLPTIMVFIYVPFLMWSLNFNFTTAFMYNLSGTIFFMFYFYAYNKVFDFIKSLFMKKLS